jgi:hypothetical protein
MAAAISPISTKMETRRSQFSELVKCFIALSLGNSVSCKKIKDNCSESPAGDLQTIFDTSSSDEEAHSLHSIYQAISSFQLLADRSVESIQNLEQLGPLLSAEVTMKDGYVFTMENRELCVMLVSKS